MFDRPFRTAARYYEARPPYSAELRPALTKLFGWDGCGRLLDIGSGPGTIALDLAPAFREVIALDPEPQMLAEGRARSRFEHVQWVQGRAEDIPDLSLGSFQAATLGQSLHRTDRELTLRIVHDLLLPGGAILLIHHSIRGFGMPERPGFTPRIPAGPPGIPPIPYKIVWDAIERYIGFVPAAPPADQERYIALLGRSVFGGGEELTLPGRLDIIRTAEGVLDMFLSTSFAAPERFGNRLEAFRAEVLSNLRSESETGTFWDWPGDTEVLVARKR